MRTTIEYLAPRTQINLNRKKNNFCAKFYHLHAKIKNGLA